MRCRNHSKGGAAPCKRWFQARTIFRLIGFSGHHEFHAMIRADNWVSLPTVKKSGPMRNPRVLGRGRFGRLHQLQRWLQAWTPVMSRVDCCFRSRPHASCILNASRCPCTSPVFLSRAPSCAQIPGAKLVLEMEKMGGVHGLPNGFTNCCDRARRSNCCHQACKCSDAAVADAAPHNLSRQAGSDTEGTPGSV